MFKDSLQTAFNEAYASLNAAQQHAVDTIEGPVMVVAGPGTGKTQILALRIANILRLTQLQPENILALTFTDAGVKAMRERLHRYLGPAAYRVAVYTFHGFAERLIREYPDTYKRVIGSRPANALEKISLMETILDDPSLRYLRPIGDPFHHVNIILRTIGSLKDEYITPNAFADIIRRQEKSLKGIEQFHTKGAYKDKVRGEYKIAEKSVAKNQELLRVYRHYEALLIEKRLFDFEDMIVETVTALKTDEDFLRELQEQYQYILADEHQDVNGGQNTILTLLASYHETPNIFAVGDEKQAIYRFQGASLENFLSFESLFNGTKTISLNENYRSGQTILNVAGSLVATGDPTLAALRIPLVAKVVTAASVTCRTFSHQDVEDAFVVAEIKRLLATGVSAEEIAIIVRTNKEVEQFAHILRRAEISVTATADGDILEHPITHSIESLLRAVIESNSEIALFNVLHGAYWGISMDDLVRIASQRSYSTSLWSILNNEILLTECGVKNIEAITHLVAVLEEARQREANEPPHRILEYILQASGFLDHILTMDPLEGGRVVRRIYDEIEQMVMRDNLATLRSVCVVFSSHRQHHIALTAPYVTSQMDSVHVMTAHKSKGLEFDTVFIPHMVDSVWGGRAKTSFFKIPYERFAVNVETALDDERRLFYVAMTRAKTKLYFSVADVNAAGKALVISRLLTDCDETYITNVNVADEELAFRPTAQLETSRAKIVIELQLLIVQLAERGLSATALNNYLKSPWTYVYRNVLRAPEIKTQSLLFGTVVHGVMEWVSVVVAQTGQVPNTIQVSTQLKTKLERLPIGHTEYTQLHQKGLEVLTVYLDNQAANITQNTKVEFTIRATLPTGLPEFPEVTLTGKLDRLDFDNDGRVISVIDYKTGKPKTRNAIEGKTKNSNGDYKRQLVFYALLLSLYGDERYACRMGRLSFIEPDDKGRIHEESFEITDDEISTLRDEIIKMVAEITTGAFLTSPCDPSKCDYCHLVNLLRARSAISK